MNVNQAQRIRRILPYFRGCGPAFAALLAATCVVALTEPVIPALMKPLLDNGFQGANFNLWLVPLALLGLFGLRGISGFIAQYSLAHMANKAMVQLRGRLFARVLDAPMSLFAHTSASALSNTVVYEVQTGTTLLVTTMLTLIRDSLTLVALMAYLFYINWKLTLIVLVIFPGVALVMKVLSRRLHRITQANQDATDRLAYVVEENVLAHRVVRLHEAQAAQGERFGQLSGELRRLAMKSTVAASAMTPLTQMLAAGALSAVICTALWQSSTSGITVGGFAAFVTAMLMLIAPIKHLSESASPITRGLAAVERGLDLIEHTEPEREGTHEAARACGEIALEDVTVRYEDSARDALESVSLRVAPGETVALVGGSGSGKTTLVNLLPRFVVPSSGRILLDGVELHDWRLNALRRQFAFVSQEVVMFNDTIASNITLGLPVDRERIARALEAANLSEHVATLPQGMDTLVGHNARQLSGGQRQRLAIARAIYKDAPILVLDEATSALDTESEQAVKSALQRLMAGRTTLIIAHRLSTIEHADRILVMASGRVVEEGSHAELLRRGGHYARLYSVASAEGSNPASPSDLLG
ncbi:lipid A export permease/ATP-binding protein MsbA [Caenimonas aquaedulcis]|uniref:Lipid A export permease/ATP-binding protein MsbA n=1 Tax=Caenimonas aquaedulcis TaxID=2793270 RepID=A0A931H1P1_9BURK|nr:lipid A export permease/ATP-binding protein MsbA [Caenimonas aquaedulcis]MBG9386864.1 lipid A export permease/ATP-binding protein MsbA [Caenimonas aquaedulcis]